MNWLLLQAASVFVAFESREWKPAGSPSKLSKILMHSPRVSMKSNSDLTEIAPDIVPSMDFRVCRLRSKFGSWTANDSGTTEPVLIQNFFFLKSSEFSHFAGPTS